MCHVPGALLPRVPSFTLQWVYIVQGIGGIRRTFKSLVTKPGIAIQHMHGGRVQAGARYRDWEMLQRRSDHLATATQALFTD